MELIHLVRDSVRTPFALARTGWVAAIEYLQDVTIGANQIHSPHVLVS